MSNQQKAIKELEQARTFREIADRHERNAIKLLGTVKKEKKLPIEFESAIQKARIRQGRA